MYEHPSDDICDVDPWDRLAEVVDALTELNYPGSEFESVIDELADAFSQYRAHRT